MIDNQFKLNCVTYNLCDMFRLVPFFPYLCSGLPAVRAALPPRPRSGRPLRGVAQLASASGLGPEGRVFESHHPDRKSRVLPGFSCRGDVPSSSMTGGLIPQTPCVASLRCENGPLVRISFVHKYLIVPSFCCTYLAEWVGNGLVWGEEIKKSILLAFLSVHIRCVQRDCPLFFVSL